MPGVAPKRNGFGKNAVDPTIKKSIEKLGTHPSLHLEAKNENCNMAKATVRGKSD